MNGCMKAALLDSRCCIVQGSAMQGKITPHNKTGDNTGLWAHASRCPVAGIFVQPPSPPPASFARWGVIWLHNHKNQLR